MGAAIYCRGARSPSNAGRARPVYLCRELCRRRDRPRWAGSARDPRLAARRIMTDKTIKLDQHRGMSAQKATDLRRLLSGVEADKKALRSRQEALEKQFISEPATAWEQAR